MTCETNNCPPNYYKLRYYIARLFKLVQLKAEIKEKANKIVSDVDIEVSFRCPTVDVNKLPIGLNESGLAESDLDNLILLFDAIIEFLRAPIIILQGADIFWGNKILRVQFEKSLSSDTRNFLKNNKLSYGMIARIQMALGFIKGPIAQELSLLDQACLEGSEEYSAKNVPDKLKIIKQIDHLSMQILNILKKKDLLKFPENDLRN